MGGSSTPVFQWLESIGLGYSVEHFRILGIDTPDKFAAFSLPDYDLVGVTDTEDRKRLFFLVQRVKLAVEERAKTEADKLAMSTTGGSMLGRLTGRLAATAKAPQQPPQQHQDSGAGLSRTMREQVLSVDLSGVVDALPSLHSGSSPQPSSQPQQAQPSHISLDSSSLGRSLLFSLSASATPEPFRRDADIAWTTAAPSAPPQPPTYYLPSSSKAQLSASSPPGAPFPSSSASYPTSESPSFSMNPPTGNGGLGKHSRKTSSASSSRGLLSALGGASSHKRKGSSHHHPTTRIEALVGMIAEGPKEEDDMAIQVVVRKRPLTQMEKNRGDTDILESQPPRTVVVHEPKKQLDLTPFTESHYFAFDRSFDHLAGNEQIYGEACLPLVTALFRGGRSTCFAYGQTGSGKTFTMMGSGNTGHHERATASSAATAQANNAPAANPGLYELAAHDIFQIIAHPRFAARGWSLHVSFYEIYGGKLFDLLNRRAVVRCLEDAKQQVQFLGLSEQHVRNVDDLLGVIAEGQRQRSTGSTAANADSSRSHAVLQLSLKAPTPAPAARRDAAAAAASKRGGGGNKRGGAVRVIRESNEGCGGKGQGGKSKQPVVGTFSFIDLAGSERGADTRHADKATRLEGAEINTSLLALKEVIRALDKKQTHTPFRGSKLTQVLKDSLVGANARTVMVACIAPSLSACEHTLNTLRYADRVKEQDASTAAAAATNSHSDSSPGALSASATALRRGSGADNSVSLPSSSPTAATTAGESAFPPPSSPPQQHHKQQQQPQQRRGCGRGDATGAGCLAGQEGKEREAVLASALEEAREVQAYVRQLKEQRTAAKARRCSQEQQQEEVRMLHSLSSSSSSSSSSSDGDGMEEERERLEGAYWQATKGLIDVHQQTHTQLLNTLREEVDLLHVTDGDRGGGSSSFEGYLHSVDVLLEEQDQQLERIRAHLEHVKAAKAKLLLLLR